MLFEKGHSLRSQRGREGHTETWSYIHRTQYDALPHLFISKVYGHQTVFTVYCSLKEVSYLCLANGYCLDGHYEKQETSVQPEQALAYEI